MKTSGVLLMSLDREISFCDRVKIFRELNSLPLPLNHLEEEVSLDDLVINRASWHKSCYCKFSHDKIERARKGVASESEVLAKLSGLAPPVNLLTRMLVFSVKKRVLPFMNF